MNVRESQAKPSRWRWEFLIDLAAALACLFALYHGIQAARDLQYPYNIDLYRDIGTGQVIRDGAFGADSAYLGETFWYNPLLPTIAALIGIVTGAPMNLVYTQTGALINIFIPITFYILLAQCFTRRTALLSMLALLFLDSHIERIISFNAYTIMLVASRTMLTMFFVTLLAWKKAAESHQWRFVVLTGILLGITFLGHTAPALLLGVIITLQLLFASLQQIIKPPIDVPSDKRFSPIVRDITQYIVIILIAFIVSLPYTLSIVWRYGLNILNPFPNNWIPENLLLDHLPQLIEAQNNPVTWIALLGLIAVFWQRPIVRNMLLFWLAGTLGWLAYNYAAQQNPSLPRVIPPIHFYFYFEILKFVLFGLGITGTLALVRRTAVGMQSTASPIPILVESVQLTLIAALIIYVGAPNFSNNFDFQRPPFPNGQWASDERIQTIEWIRQNTAPDAVFLAPDGLDLPVIAPSGRRMVCIAIFWSNPYVNWEIRNADRVTMLDALLRGDARGFELVAERYQVEYILLAANQPLPTYLEPAYSNSELVIYHVGR